MQAIATANAKADIEMEGKKYGNLQQDLWFDNDNQYQRYAWKKKLNCKFYETKNQDKFTYLSQKESFGNRFGYFIVGCNIIFTQIIRERSKSVLNKIDM